MTDLSSRASGRMRRAVRLVLASDIVMMHGAIVVAMAVALEVLPDSVHADVVRHSSTNLVNLRERPIYVLLVSAFVVSNLAGLWLVPWLMLSYAATQRWLGRLATVFAALLGRIGATVFVAVLLSAGIWHGWLAPTVAHEPDVGVSYGLACLAGLLVMQVAATVARRLRRAGGSVLRRPADPGSDLHRRRAHHRPRHGVRVRVGVARRASRDSVPAGTSRRTVWAARSRKPRCRWRRIGQDP